MWPRHPGSHLSRRDPQPPLMAMGNAFAEVTLQCVRSDKLRVRIVSAGYMPGANCQFPRALRVEGRRYAVPAVDVRLARGAGGTYFYRVKASAIRALGADEAIEQPRHHLAHVYEHEDPACAICMDAPKDRIAVPCGHFYACAGCARRSVQCAMCRAHVEVWITPADVSAD